ncbi:hypothetical protein D3C85_1608320 [compost metagenome]
MRWMASATSLEVELAAWLRSSIMSLVWPTVCEALMTWPTTASRLSMKLLIQRPMSPLSSLAMVAVSRRWRRLPSPSAMVRTTSVIAFKRVARRRGPRAQNSAVASSMLAPWVASTQNCSSPL